MAVSASSETRRPGLRKKPWTPWLIGAASMFLFALPATAGQDAQAREARTACLAGDYNKGVTILSELFVSTREPTHIYNQGRCFEQNARFREAISRFQEYLRIAKDVPADARAEAEKHIADCKALMAQESAASATNPAAPVPVREDTPRSIAQPSPAPQPSAPSPSDVVSGSKPASAEPTGEGGSGLRTAGIVTASVGGAALVAGILLNLKVNDISSGYETYNGYTEQKESQRKSYETWGWISYGAGAACVATGALLYYLGMRASRDGSTSVAVAPARDGAVLLVGGTL
jgi:hypothetical protein